MNAGWQAALIPVHLILSLHQLIFADLSLVGGHEALDFFIRTGGVYFKGRALMVKNSLYLMAMECEVQNYDEIHYKKFIESFQLSQ